MGEAALDTAGASNKGLLEPFPASAALSSYALLSLTSLLQGSPRQGSPEQGFDEDTPRGAKCSKVSLAAPCSEFK